VEWHYSSFASVSAQRITEICVANRITGSILPKICVLSLSHSPMEFRVVLGDWATQQFAARLVRDEVFIHEQKISVEDEWDDMDAVCVHAIVYGPDDEVLGTGRLLPDGHIGRMAVRKAARGAGVGAAILKELKAEAKLRGHKDVVLSAQMQVEPFYARCGFVREGDEYMDVGMPHIQMRCKLV